MYITDIRHFLDDKGAIGPRRGPARRIAEFHAAAVAYATDFDGSGLTAPSCFKCKQAAVEMSIAPADTIDWSCPRCRSGGRISNWQGTFWDLSKRPQALGR